VVNLSLPRPSKHGISFCLGILHDWITMLILTAFPSECRKRPPRHPRIIWMTVLNDLESTVHSLTLTEAVNMAQNRPLWRLLAVSGTCQHCVNVLVHYTSAICILPKFSSFTPSFGLLVYIHILVLHKFAKFRKYYYCYYYYYYREYYYYYYCKHYCKKKLNSLKC